MQNNELDLLTMNHLPREVFVRQQSVPAQHYFPQHQHDWHQLLYATSGVLIVDVVGERLFIPPERAVWLPCNSLHSVSTEFGAELKSLYITANYQQLETQKSLVLEISSLMRELIIEAALFPAKYPKKGYEAEVMSLILNTLPRLKQNIANLPWPSSSELFSLCNKLYNRPGVRIPTEKLAEELALSKRTLERKFRRETGMSVQNWCLRLRFLKAIELLSSGQSVTTVALELGYSSPSPFIYMFREQSGISPGQYINNQHNN